MPELPVFAFGLTDVGGRKTNEDAFHTPEQHESKFADRGRLYVVADGTGGQEGGRTASAWAAEVVAEKYYDFTSEDVGENLRTAIQSAHMALFHLAEAVTSWRSMSTTLVAVVVKDHEYWVAHVGDSRLYLARGDKIQQVTQDHTWADDDENFGSLTRWLGGGDQPAVEIDVHHDTLQDDDVLILCTDGLYSQISKDDMRDLTKRKSVKLAVPEMIAIAKAHGTTDNTTAIAVRLGDSHHVEAVKIPRKTLIVGGGIAAAAAALILIIALLSGVPPRPPTDPTGEVIMLPTAVILETPATPTIENTLAPGMPTVTRRPPTDTPIPLPTARPVTLAPVVIPVIPPGVTVATSVPPCPGKQVWNQNRNRCENPPDVPKDPDRDPDR